MNWPVRAGGTKRACINHPSAPPTGQDGWCDRDGNTFTLTLSFTGEGLSSKDVVLLTVGIAKMDLEPGWMASMEIHICLANI